MIQAPVGFKCPECGKGTKTHVEEITNNQYLIGGASGIIIGAGAGYIWHYLSMYGLLVSLAVAYAVGFCVSKAISASIGNKIGLNIQIFTATITLISIVYNPIIIVMALLSGAWLPQVVIMMSMSLFSLYMIVAVVIAVWAAIRHFRM